MLAELHPIENVSLCEAYPTLGMLNCCLPAYPRPRNQDGSDLTEPLIDEKEKKESKAKKIIINGKEVMKKSKKKKKNNIKNEEIFKARPLARLGFGITAYIDILWFMILAFGLFTLMLWPTMTFYHDDSDQRQDAIDKLNIGYENGMLGNIGYSSVQCASIPAAVGDLQVSCPYGTIGATDGKPLDFGVNQGA